MHESELKAVVEAVIRVLEQRGLLKSGCSCAAPSPAAAGAISAAAGAISAAAGAEGVRVTIGTAGKVFSEGSPYAPGLAQAARPVAGAIPAVAGASPETDHTRSPGCPHCEPLSRIDKAQLKDVGADRVGVCHTTSNCARIAPTVDHTLLKPNATQEEVAKLCAEARKHVFASVCVNPSYVPLCAQLLRGSGVAVCTVIGFPLGSTTPTVKAIEARDAIANGADEIDMVLNVGALKSGNDAYVREDMRAVREATRGKLLKVILETALLSREEKVRACRMAKEVGADFVKTSTGFGPGGATVEDIRLMRETVGPRMGVKASGGIRDCATAQAMLSAGATRLGTSASVAIVTDSKGEAGGKY